MPTTTFTATDPELRAKLTEFLDQEELSDAGRQSVLALGQAAIPPLLAIVDQEVAAKGTGEGMEPLHAISLLGELKAQALVDRCVALLPFASPTEMMGDALFDALEALGAPAVESLLQRLATEDDPARRMAILDTLLTLQVKDERLFQALVAMLDHDTRSAANFLEDYGDPRAVEPLGRAAERFAARIEEDRVGHYRLLDSLLMTIEELGGTAPAAAVAVRDEIDAQDNRAFSSMSRRLGAQRPTHGAPMDAAAKKTRKEVRKKKKAARKKSR